MVIKEHLLEKIIKDSAQFLSILIYGPNEGLVKDQIGKLIKIIYHKVNMKKLVLMEKI